MRFAARASSLAVIIPCPCYHPHCSIGTDECCINVNNSILRQLTSTLHGKLADHIDVTIECTLKSSIWKFFATKFFARGIVDRAHHFPEEPTT